MDLVLVLVREFWGTLAEMSPYLLFGFLVAGMLSVFISPDVVERHLGGKGLWPLLKATLFGIPLPLCSCGVIPVSMSLRKHGASKGATVSFLLSTPQTGADSILVTLSLLGPIFAIFRPLASLVTGLVGGGLVSLFDPGKSADDQTGESQGQCSDECCEHKEKKSRFSRAMRYGFVVLPRDIGRAMLIGLAIAAVISAVVPEDFFVPLLGGGIVAMLIMMVLGIPVYVCATASVPVAVALIAKGLSPGAALVFLMTGPATNAAAFMTIWSVLGRRTAIIYIVTVAVCALAGGMAIEHFVPVGGMEAAAKMGPMLPGVVKNICAAALVVVLGVGIYTKKARIEQEK